MRSPKAVEILKLSLQIKKFSTDLLNGKVKKIGP